uniref:DnaJ homolog subfamily B member 9 n=1 Tax=Acrobeloides nanus TaxID=290746 RepID=A0A914D411_9BILA
MGKNISKDCYSILGIPKNASDDQIKQAYRNLARQYHPDKNNDPTAKAQYQDILEAYRILTNQVQTYENGSFLGRLTVALTRRIFQERPPEARVSNVFSNNPEELEEPLQEVRMICGQCQNHLPSIVYNCCHLSCDTCDEQIFACRLCSETIVSRIRMEFD